MKKMNALASLVGKNASDITAEEIDAVNTELTEAGINAVVLIAADEAESLRSVAAELETTNGLATSREAELNTANERISSLEAEVEALKNPAGKEGHSAENGTDTETKGEPDAGDALNEKILKEIEEKFGL